MSPHTHPPAICTVCWCNLYAFPVVLGHEVINAIQLPTWSYQTLYPFQPQLAKVIPQLLEQALQHTIPVSEHVLIDVLLE